MKNIARKRMATPLALLISVLAVSAAVVLPQVCHLLGDLLGVQTALGEMLLPMHLPVMLAGLWGGPVAGAVAGLVSPVISHGLTAMPAALMVPFMMVELTVYGLVAGLLRDCKISPFAKVPVIQVSGRAVRALALVAAYGLGAATPPLTIIWTSISLGAAGILLQWVLIPLLVRRDKR